MRARAGDDASADVREEEDFEVDDAMDDASDDESECEDEVTTLRHRAHGRCAAMAWRPRRGRALARAGASGVCGWTRERRATRVARSGRGLGDQGHAVAHTRESTSKGRGRGDF